MKKGIYLFSGAAQHPKYNLDYCDPDIFSNSNIKKSCHEVDLSKYDYFIATPPCNYWSKARGNKKPSLYAISTKYLLKWSIEELSKYNKPLIIENVRNYKKFCNEGIIQAANNNGLFIHFIGRHTYFTNQFINLLNKQQYDFKQHGLRLAAQSKIEGGLNVFNTIEIFLEGVNNG